MQSTQKVPRTLAAKLGWAIRRSAFSSGQGERYHEARRQLRCLLDQVARFRELKPTERVYL